MKTLTYGLITFSITFGISFSLVGLLFGFPSLSQEFRSSFEPSSKSAIKRVIESDIRFGEKRRQAERRVVFKSKYCKGYDGDSKYAQVVDKYASASSKINVSKTPSDFRYAWNKHMKTWQVHAASAQAKANGDESALDNTKEINESWAQVLRIADRYGVPIKRRYLR